MNRLQNLYKTKVIPELQTELGLSNPLAVPTVEKVVLNIGLGKVREDKSFVQACKDELALICGQAVYQRMAKKSIAGFKVRQGQLVGLAATLRGERMWSFLDRLFNIALPRTRDFRGLSAKSFDGHGNYSLGISDHTIFPEIDTSKAVGIKSFQITITTSAKDDTVAQKLLEKLGLPLGERG